MKRAIVLILALLLSAGAAHETQIVETDGAEYRIIVGYSTEPAYTDERNGLDLFVRLADGTPVNNLENALSVTLVAPDGTERQLDLRAVHGVEGSYTADFILTATGIYQTQVTGFLGDEEIDLVFEMHEVGDLSELRFP